MSAQTVILLIAIAMIVAIAFGWARRGTRVTTIEHKREKESGDA